MGLTVNVSKTKHMLLNSKYLVNQTCALHFNGENIDRTESTKYLGIEFSHDGNMQIAKFRPIQERLEGLLQTRSSKPFRHQEYQ